MKLENSDLVFHGSCWKDYNDRWLAQNKRWKLIEKMSQFAVQSITLSINNSAPQYEMRHKSYEAHFEQIAHKKLGLYDKMRV